MKKIFSFTWKTVLILFVIFNVLIAFHAYKFTHFYTNVDSNSNSSGLQKAGNILFGQKFPKVVNKHFPDSAYKTIKLTTADKAQINSWYFSNTAAKGTFIVFHGHASNVGNHLDEKNALYALGYNVLLVDFRAHGSSAGETCLIGMVENEEVAAAYNYVKDSLHEKNIILIGSSMGAAAVAHALDANNLKPNKVILQMSFASLHDAVKGKIRTMGLPSQPASALLTFWGGIENSKWAFNFKPSESIKKYDGPLRVFWGRKDNRVTEEETNLIYNNSPSKDKKLVIFENSGHEHLVKSENQKWLAEITEFINY